MGFLNYFSVSVEDPGYFLMVKNQRNSKSVTNQYVKI